MTHEEVRDALSFYASGRADAAMRERLETHLRGCPECQEALRADYHSADALGRGVDQVRPRPALRQQVIGSIAGAASQAARPDVVIERGVGRWHWLAAAAATVAIIASLGLFYARRELAEVRAELVAWQLRVAEAEDRAARASTEAVSQRRVVAVLTATDLLHARLSGIAPAAAARARAFVSASSGTIVFSAEGLPALPADRVYQLWAIVGTTPVSAGVFSPGADGRSQVVAQLPPLDGPPTTIAVTLEPAGGVPKPTGPIYLAGATSN